MLKEYEEYGLAETKDRFSALTSKANSTGRPFRVLKGGKPWVEVVPLAPKEPMSSDGIVIEPCTRTVTVADLDALFEGFDETSFVPREDGFAGASGLEVM